jgi:hypothetical protein
VHYLKTIGILLALCVGAVAWAAPRGGRALSPVFLFAGMALLLSALGYLIGAYYEPEAGGYFGLAAAIGICWPDRRLGVTLRECRRDVIEYGERVVTGLWALGYRDAEEITRVGQGLYEAALQDLQDEQAAVADAAEDFGGAQP